MMNKRDPYQAERDKWRNLERGRPAKIDKPGPGQESVWDYPRPPRVERVPQKIRVEFGGIVVADSDRALRVIETSSPPVYYLPPENVLVEYLEVNGQQTFCEWKGVARYFNIRVGERFAENASWSYPDPDAGYKAIRNHIAFYAGKMDACYVGEHQAIPQPGDFYGGWITPTIVGPFKGPPGTESW